MAQTITDATLMQNVISGIRPQDIARLQEKVTIPTGFGDLQAKRIARSPDVGNGIVADEVAVVEEVSLGWGEIYQTYGPMLEEYDTNGRFM